MFASGTPSFVGVVIVIFAAAAIASVVTLVTARRGTRRSDVRLPQGADAALWSIVEAVPDPRNHLAMTRDLSGEVKITDQDRAVAEVLFADAPRKATPITQRRRPRRDDDLALTGGLFGPSEAS
jgi:uncharacterized membrane protein